MIKWERIGVLRRLSSSIRAVGAGQKRDPPTAARDQTRSTTSSPKRRTSRSRSSRRVPTATTALGSMHWSMRSRRSAAGVEGRFRNLKSYSATEGYDHGKYCRPLHAAGNTTQIARRGQSRGSGLGKTCWVVERTISWLHNFRRLRIRFERLAFIHDAFLKLACCIICWRPLQTSFC